MMTADNLYWSTLPPSAAVSAAVHVAAIWYMPSAAEQLRRSVPFYSLLITSIMYLGTKKLE